MKYTSATECQLFNLIRQKFLMDKNIELHTNNILFTTSNHDAMISIWPIYDCLFSVRTNLQAGLTGVSLQDILMHYDQRRIFLDADKSEYQAIITLCDLLISPLLFCIDASLLCEFEWDKI